MAYLILLNESAASRRAVPIWLVGSDGTSPATSESNNTFFFSIGGADYGSGGSLSAVSAGGGHYSCNFAASKVSVLGPGFVYYRSASALASSTPIQVVPTDSYDSMRLGLFALPNAAPAASGGLPTFGTGAGQLNLSTGSVGLIATTMSGVTIQGISNYSNATVVVGSIVAATYSGVTVGVNNIAANTYSGVTLQGLTNYSNATVGVNNIQANSYSGVTIQGISNYSNATVIVGSIVSGSYSGVTFGIDNIKPIAYSGVTLDGAKFLSVAGERSVASSIMSTNLGNTRYVQDALRVLRNRVDVGASIMTVYQENDTSSAWTASITTSASALPITGIDPAG